MTSSEQLFVSGLDVFSSVVDAVGVDDWNKPSACAGWTNLDVLGHLGSSVDMGIKLLSGEQPSFPDAATPGELVVGRPSDYWAGLALAARAAVEGADLDLVMDTPMGKRTVRDRLAFPAMDLYIHARDIGHGLGIDVVLPDDLIEFSHDYIDPFPKDMVRGENGAFGPELDPPADATAAERYLAWTGRAPR